MGRQQANRYQMALDEDYYDSIQWTPDEAAAVRARGQNPIVYNEVKPTIDWLIGTERRMRRDFKVLARNDRSKEASGDAQEKTKLLKYLDDVNRAPFERSLAADDVWKAGLRACAPTRKTSRSTCARSPGLLADGVQRATLASMPVRLRKPGYRARRR